MRFVVVSLALAIASVGCSNSSSKSDSPTGDSAQEAMGHYAKGFNALLDEPNRMVSDYFDRIPSDGPDTKSPPKLFPRHTHAGNDITEAKEAFKAGKAAAPQSMANLAPAADKALAAIDKVSTVFAAAHKYYDSQDYKDDGFAKGKQLHQDMVASSKDFKDAINELQTGLSAIEDQQATAELAKYNPKQYSYWFRYYNQQAKKFLNKVEAGGDPSEAFNPVDKALTDMTAMAAEKSPPNTVFKTYIDTATRYHSTAKKLLRAIKEADDKKNADQVNQLNGALVDAYNGLVSSARGLYSMEANDLLK